jgi:CHAT domain-containing protein
VTVRDVRSAFGTKPRRLAILSSCESGMNDLASPNEALGLPAALLELGFAGVIATSWQVDDQVCKYLMTCFYHLWQSKDVSPVGALASAQHWIRSATRSEPRQLFPGESVGVAGPYPFEHPRYWAAFTYTGT